jgi:AcrR family transcriptional regulator
MTTVTRSTKEQIVLAAERLFAEHGIDGVSLRQIGAALGKGNGSAVQYHFGSKEALVQAIFEYRLPTLHERLDFLIAERRPDDLRSWVACQLRAVLEQSEVRGSSYSGFVAMLYQYGRRDLFDQLPEATVQYAQTLYDRLRSFLTEVPEPLRSHRTARAMAMITQFGADRERARLNGHEGLPFALEFNDLLDGIVGFLEAPVSGETTAVLERSDAVTADWFLGP